MFTASNGFIFSCSRVLRYFVQVVDSCVDTNIEIIYQPNTNPEMKFTVNIFSGFSLTSRIRRSEKVGKSSETE